MLPVLLLIGTIRVARSSPKANFKENGAGSLNFMVVGDWGGQSDHPYYTDPEQDVAKEMGKVAAAIGSQFTLSMGDNFYDNGVTDVDDPRFKETFEVCLISSEEFGCHRIYFEAVECGTFPSFMIHGTPQSRR